MAVPVSQMATVASYVMGQKIRRNKRYPLVLMLEPLFRCNLSCAGCGKIQYPGHILKRQLSAEQCLAAADECGAPIVSIPGGEPLMHEEMPAIVRGLVERKKYIYLCTNALLLKEKLEAGDYQPTKYLSFSVHMDGPKAEHDYSVCRDGTYDQAIEGIKLAVERGFRVTTNTTLFAGADPEKMHGFFDDMMDLNIESMMLSPGYSYSKAPNQESFLGREKTKGLFKRILGKPKKSWRFNHSPMFLRFLEGKIEYDCTPWGNPTYCIFGWQKPCYLLQEGYADSFAELMSETDWDAYGHRNNEKCRDCMVHSGYEATAVDDTFSSPMGIFRTVKAMVS
ncbi:MAG: adenosyl-hopene transferase HpnH [Planctomycetota bacterium]